MTDLQYCPSIAGGLCSSHSSAGRSLVGYEEWKSVICNMQHSFPSVELQVQG